MHHERTIEFGSVFDGGAPASLAKLQGHFVVIDIMAKTTFGPLMSVWLSGRCSTPERNER